MKRIPLVASIILLLCCYANAQSEVDPGFVKDGVYTNRSLGFTYKYPKDWVVHGEATVERIKEVGKEKVVDSGVLSKSSAEVAVKNTHYLLTVFRHPLGTPGIAINSAVLVMAEKVDYAPGITSGKDYLLNLRPFMQKMGATALSDEPKEYRFAGWQFFRADSAMEINGARLVQAHLATIVNGYAVVFIFTGEDRKSVDEMTKSMETFAITPPIRKGVTVIIEPAAKPKP
jgi:hypothetical protein